MKIETKARLLLVGLVLDLALLWLVGAVLPNGSWGKLVVLIVSAVFAISGMVWVIRNWNNWPKKGETQE